MLNSNFLILTSFVVFLVILIKKIIKKQPPLQMFVFSSFYIYIVSVLSIVFFPFPYQQNYLEHLRSLPDQPQNNFLPFNDIATILTHDSPRDALIQIGGNVLMLCPFGFLLPVMIPRLKLSKVLMFGVLFSVFIETTQLMLDTIINYNYRTSDIDDVILNTFGVAMGCIVFTTLNTPLKLTAIFSSDSRVTPGVD